MKKCVSKIISLGTCAVLLCSSIYTGVYAAGNINEDRKVNLSSDSNVQPDNKAADKITKNETVYVFTDADGKTAKIIVSDWLKNAVSDDSIIDKSELTGIENIKGNNSYTLNGDGVMTWEAGGKDIYYQGVIEKELPIALNVSYILDGKNITAEELAGKSGRVTIRFDYKNNQYRSVDINGVKRNIYVPFTVLTGILLDTACFTNISVTNGKLINDGDRCAVIGIAFPGLQSNLELNKEKLELPEFIEVSADVTNFKISNTLTVATNSLFSRMDSSKLDSADKLSDSLNEFADALSKLTDGSSQLYNGLCTLLEKTDDLTAGVDKLADGANALKNGSAELTQGISQLQSGSAELSGGLSSLTSNSGALKSGAKQVFESLLSAADTQLAAAGFKLPALTTDNYSKVLESAAASLDEASVQKLAYNTALEKVTAAVNSQRATVTAAVTAAVKDEVTEKVLAAMNLTKDSYEAGIDAGTISLQQQEQINAAVDKQMNSAEIKAIISSQTDRQISALIEENMASSEVKGQIAAAVDKAISGAESINELKNQLDSYNEFYTGLIAYTDGVAVVSKGADKLQAGIGELKSGSDRLYDGTKELYGGIAALQDSCPALQAGITELRDGSLKLFDGLKEFNEQGVQKLIDAADGDIFGLLDGLKASIEVSKEYTSFSGIGDGMDGQVKFIYRTEQIKLS